jgi:hypothetical protein
MASQRKHLRRIGALKRFPKSAASRKGKRTEEQWQIERDKLALSVQRQ